MNGDDLSVDPSSVALSAIDCANRTPLKISKPPAHRHSRRHAHRSRANELLHNQVIVIRGDKIETVGDAASTQVPEARKVIDLSNATVLPA